ncbi:MAG TPA: hypothetical protein VK912_03625 [Longimicrobiales bacterium]|nr:hypothetical protein [Longimicrobiales bacterium]
MHPRREAPALSSLAAVGKGDEIQIREILFDGLRAHCEGLDVSVGDRVQCRAAGHAAILLLTPRGRSVSLRIDLARFIKVSYA